MLIRSSIEPSESRKLSTLSIFVAHFMKQENSNVPERERILWIEATDERSFAMLSSAADSGCWKASEEGDVLHST